jgi:hypothetical protein
MRVCPAANSDVFYKVNSMRILESYQLPNVSGGDYWCAEGSDGSASEQEAAMYSSNYGSPTAGLAIRQSVSGETLSLCYTTQVGAVSTQTCYNQDGTKTVQTCANAGPSASLLGVGLGATVNACGTTTTYWNTP